METFTEENNLLAPVTTSVKIDEGSKDRLEQLQAQIKLETGRNVTQQELLDRIIEREFESSEALVDAFREGFDGLSEDEIDEWLSWTFDSGASIDEDDIDRILYEEEAGSE